LFAFSNQVPFEAPNISSVYPKKLEYFFQKRDILKVENLIGVWVYYHFGTFFPICASQCLNIVLLANSYFAKNVPLNRTLCINSRYLTNQLGENNESTPQKQQINSAETTNCRRENNELTATL
jgi:hypothetical protein